MVCVSRMFGLDRSDDAAEFFLVQVRRFVRTSPGGFIEALIFLALQRGNVKNRLLRRQRKSPSD
jgi:hypothetical protein